MKDKGKDIIFKEKPIVAMTDYEKYANKKYKATVVGIIHVIAINYEYLISLFETGI